MEFLESYNKTELSKIKETPYSRILKDKDLYIPVKIITAQSRATKKGYTIRYLKREDVEQYLRETKPMKSYVRLNDKKYKKTLKND